LSFGFSHPVKWPHVVHAPLIAIGHFVLLDLTAWRFDMSVVYIPELFCNLALVALFNLFVLFDVDGRVHRCIYKMRNTDVFKEMRERAAKATSPQCHWIHRITDALMDLRLNGSSTWLSSGAFFGLVRVLTLSSYLVSQVKWLCSTILVVPILRKAVSTFDCQERDGVYYSSYAPNTECFQGDHLILCVGVVLLVPPFLFFVLPYAVVDGDSQFCPRCSTFNWRVWHDDNHWRASAQRKATRVDLGFLRPHPQFAFSSRLVDLVQKVLLPLIFMPLFGRHFGERAQIQMPFAAVLALWVVYCTIQNPPMLQLKQQRVVLCIKLFILAVMSTGLLTAIVDNETNFISLVLLFCLTSAIFVYMMYGLFTIPLQTRSRRRWEVEEIGEPWPQGR